MMQLITTEIRSWLKDWVVRLVVLSSAFLPVMLVAQGICRKSSYSWHLKAVLWSTYIASSWAAVVALGVLLNRLSDIKGKTGLSPNDQLTAFWAPFLLLHLGGTDSITAFSLEDNELWLRSTATLIAKSGLTVYIYFLALTGSPLSVLAATMTMVGFVKCVERILTLYKASKKNMRDALYPLKADPIHPRIMEQYRSKKSEGYHVAFEEVIEFATPDVSDTAESSSWLANEARMEAALLLAHGLFKTFKVLFVDLILSVRDLGNCSSLFMAMDLESAFEIVATELGFMYDLLYTKAALIYGFWGIALRACTLSLTSAVLVFFTVQEWKKYERVDICMTFGLLGVAILVEFQSILQMARSDWTKVWLLKNMNRNRAIPMGSFCLRICREPTWSESVAQFSLLQLSLTREWWLARTVPWLGKLEMAVQTPFSITYKKLSPYSKAWIYEHMREWICNKKKREESRYQGRGGGSRLLFSSISFNPGEIIRAKGKYHMSWSTEDIEFEQCVLIWHIATELCYLSDRPVKYLKGKQQANYKMSPVVSSYLLNLLVMHPEMLPTVTGKLSYADTYLEARKYFEEHKSSIWQELEMGNDDPSIGRKDKERFCAGCRLTHNRAKSRALCEASHWLLKGKKEIPPSLMRGGKSKSVLFDACHLASELKAMDTMARWDLISKVWAEALFYSAFSCDGYEHAKRLSHGGELLSHVWLLMAHFGFSKKIHGPQDPVIAKVLAK